MERHLRPKVSGNQVEPSISVPEVLRGYQVESGVSDAEKNPFPFIDETLLPEANENKTDFERKKHDNVLRRGEIEPSGVQNGNEAIITTLGGNLTPVIPKPTVFKPSNLGIYFHPDGGVSHPPRENPGTEVEIVVKDNPANSWKAKSIQPRRDSEKKNWIKSLFGG